MIFGSKCGTSFISELKLWPFLIFFLFSCKSEKVVTFVYNQGPSQGTRIIKVTESNQGLFVITGSTCTSLKIFESNEGLCLRKLNGVECGYLYRFNSKEQTQNESSNTCFPYLVNDSRLIETKSYSINGRSYNVCKFVVDEFEGSHSLAYAYYVKGIGFLAYTIYFDEKTVYLEQVTSNFLDDKGILLLTNKVLNDSLFFVYPDKPLPPLPPNK